MCSLFFLVRKTYVFRRTKIQKFKSLCKNNKSVFFIWLLKPLFLDHSKLLQHKRKSKTIVHFASILLFVGINCPSKSGVQRLEFGVWAQIRSSESDKAFVLANFSWAAATLKFHYFGNVKP